MKVQESSSVENQELHRATEVNKTHNAEREENTERTDNSRDRVTISDKAREKNRESEIREDRVDSGKRTVDSGGQDMDSMKVAKQVLDEM